MSTTDLLSGLQDLMLNDSADNFSCNSTSPDALRASLAHGVSASVCLVVFLLPTLVLEIYYICRYKTTFLLRLFFYLTISVIIVDFLYVLLLTLHSQPTNNVLCHIVDGITEYALLVEMLLILTMNVILLSKVCRYSFYRHAFVHNCGGHLCKWIQTHWKLCEVAFLSIHFIVPLIITAVRNEVYWSNNPNYCWQMKDPRCFFNNTDSEDFIGSILFIYVPAALDLLLSFVVLFALLSWFCRNRNIMAGKVKLISREMGLFIAFLVTFTLCWFVSVFVALIPGPALHLITASLFPVSNGLLFVSFLVYTCLTTVCQRKRNNATQIMNSNNVPTAPPSTRVSLPSDTAAHAPNFLSPSTAELSEVTPLLGPETVQPTSAVSTYGHTVNSPSNLLPTTHEPSSTGCKGIQPLVPGMDEGTIFGEVHTQYPHNADQTQDESKIEPQELTDQ